MEVFGLVIIPFVLFGAFCGAVLVVSDLYYWIKELITGKYTFEWDRWYASSYPPCSTDPPPPKRPGYRPNVPLDTTNPPRGGSGVPRK